MGKVPKSLPGAVNRAEEWGIKGSRVFGAAGKTVDRFSPTLEKLLLRATESKVAEIKTGSSGSLENDRSGKEKKDEDAHKPPQQEPLDEKNRSQESRDHASISQHNEVPVVSSLPVGDSLEPGGGEALGIIAGAILGSTVGFASRLLSKWQELDLQDREAARAKIQELLKPFMNKSYELALSAAQDTLEQARIDMFEEFNSQIKHEENMYDYIAHNIESLSNLSQRDMNVRVAKLQPIIQAIKELESKVEDLKMRIV